MRGELCYETSFLELYHEVYNDISQDRDGYEKAKSGDTLYSG